tara:strand:- start:553 stop:1176 length:624 start_codon:yes stop_codon:yes gene_type:complete
MMNKDDKLIYEQYCHATDRQQFLMSEGLKETIAAFMLTLGIAINTGCVSMDPTEDIYPPAPGESDPGGYKKYKHNIKPWIDAFGQKGEQPENVACEPKSDKKVNPWFDYTHPWLKFTKDYQNAVPEIAVAEVKKRIGAMPGRKILRGAQRSPGHIGEDGNPPNPNDFAKWNDQDLAFNVWHSKIFWYFKTVHEVLPQVMEDIKKGSM